MNRFKPGVMLSALTLALVVIGCGRKDEETGGTDKTTPAYEPSSAATRAAAQATTVPLEGAAGDADFTGRFTITPEGTGVRVIADVAGVDTDGKHGLHIHENGKCDHDAAVGKHFSSAGGHFNPAGVEHACPPTEPRHAGDLGNIEISGSKGHLEVTATNLTADQLGGKAIILHAGEDDCKTQPTGNSGDRIACGVVGRSEQ